MLPKVKLFLGGTISVMLYAKMNNIKKVAVIQNVQHLMSFHTEVPLFVMEDAELIYGVQLLNQIINTAKDMGYKVTFLTYAMGFTENEDNNLIDY